jgi:hypothetical protein
LRAAAGVEKERNQEKKPWLAAGCWNASVLQSLSTSFISEQF